MPELPDAEIFKRYANQFFSNQSIKTVEVKDEKVLLTSKRWMSRKLSGQAFKSFYRQGKYVYGKTSNEEINLILHFGMTGYLKKYTKEEDRPAGTRVIIELEKGKMAFVNPRKFGRIGIVKDPMDFFKEKDLGPDALEISKEEFVKLYSSRRGSIKQRLMDQSLVCGIGNIYADEILYQAELHPESNVEKLKEEELASVYTIMQRVLKTAIRHHARPSDLPSHYLLFDRSEGRDCGDGHKIEKIEVGGRGTYFCPGKQKKR